MENTGTQVVARSIVPAITLTGTGLIGTVVTGTVVVVGLIGTLVVMGAVAINVFDSRRRRRVIDVD